LGYTKAGYFSFYKNRDELVAMYPDAESVLKQQSTGLEMIEVVRYHDKDVDVIFCPTREGLVLEKVKNYVGECLLEFVRRPGVDTETHGQFDDVLAVQVAKARFALFSLEAAQKSVQAPIVLPPDAQEMTFGPDSIIRTNSGDRVRRVALEVPSAAFAQQGVLDQELRQGSRYPDARNGNVEGSVVTGRGVQALMSGFDTQIRTGQAMFARTLERLVRKSLMLDDTLFATVSKTVRGNADGTPYEVKYRPEKDIDGDYTVDVQYGLMAGLDPNRALVFGLQARGDKLISRDFLRRQMPFSLNASEEEQQVDIEELRDALKQAVAGYAQAIPILAQNGQDPGEILARLSQIIIGRQKGLPMEKIVSEAFAPEPAPMLPGVEQSGVDDPNAEMLGPSGEVPPGGDGNSLAGLNDATGQLRGVAPGQSGMSPGGAPDMQTLLASMGSNGQPNLQAGVSRRLPI